MKIVNSVQMKLLDNAAQSEYKVPGLLLMENAGIEVVSVIKKCFDPLPKRAVILAGPGNNGGDGFVIARHLNRLGVSTKIYLLCKKEKLKGDAKINADIMERAGQEIHEEPADLLSALTHSSLIIDAIFGTGLNIEISGYIKEVISLVNASGRRVVSIDIPSGISSDTGKELGAAIRADITVTIGLPKIGLFLNEGSEFAGKVYTADIFIPKEAVEKCGSDIETIDIETIKPEIAKFFGHRKKDAHKNNFGHVLLIGGSKRMPGACLMASEAAIKTGAGLVTAAMPDCGYGSFLREAILFPLPQEDGIFSDKAFDILLPEVNGFDAVGLGPGITKKPATFILNILKNINAPKIIDADALNIIADNGADLLTSLVKPVIITPHTGEMARLCNITTAEVQADRINIATSFAAKYSVYVVLKGAHTVIAAPDGNVFINTTGNPGMATAGAGDVLTGMITALAGISENLGGDGKTRQANITGAIKTAVYLHGLAGDIARERLPEASITASDIIANIPEGIKRLGF